LAVLPLVIVHPPHAYFPHPEGLAKVTIPLWNGPAPLSRGGTPDDIPSLTPFPPPVAAHPTPAILVCPGGGYAEYAFDHGAFEMFEDFRRRGVAIFLLKYRLASAGYHHPAQLLDGQRALRLIRNRAAEWNIDPARVGTLGFSAGGHLASMLETQFDAGNPDAPDPIERESSRPDCAVLIYPVISAKRQLLLSGGTYGLLDPAAGTATLENAESISSELRVTPETPPTLLIHTEDDATVSIEHSRLMATALQSAGVPYEFHDYPTGKHGFGCFAADPSPPGWLDRMHRWLHGQGFGQPAQ
jgi:acetyl esterase/lipase